LNPFVRIETLCANAVERAFALAFPSELEPVQIARRLVATFESAESAGGSSAVRSYVVRISKHDAVRLAAEREPLELQWARLVVALRSRAGNGGSTVSVELREDGSLPVGTIAIDAERSDKRPTIAESVGLRVVRGIPVGAYFPLREDGRALVLGRDSACDIALGDPRVSRRHLQLKRDDAGVTFEDLGSANGTRLNGAAAARGHAVLGDRFEIGDSILVLEPQ